MDSNIVSNFSNGVFEMNHEEAVQKLIDLEAAGQLECVYLDDIPIDAYHDPRCPGVSSTTLKSVLKAEAKPKSDKPAFSFGKAFHTLVLEPELFNVTVMQTVDADEYQMMLKMQEVLKSHPKFDELFEGTSKERSFFSRDKDSGLLKKCRTDIAMGNIIVDLKSTRSVVKDTFQFDAKKFGYGFSAAYYIEIVSEVLNSRIENFHWVCVEKSMKPKVGIFHPHQDCLSKRNQEIREALEIYKTNLITPDRPYVGSSPESVEIWA